MVTFREACGVRDHLWRQVTAEVQAPAPFVGRFIKMAAHRGRKGKRGRFSRVLLHVPLTASWSLSSPFVENFAGPSSCIDLWADGIESNMFFTYLSSFAAKKNSLSQIAK